MVRRIASLVLVIALATILAGAGGTYKGRYAHLRTTYSDVSMDDAFSDAKLPVFPSPSYFAMAYDEAGDITGYSGGYDQYVADAATQDIVVFDARFFDTGIGSEADTLNHIVADIHAINPHVVIGGYTNIVAINTSFETHKTDRWKGRLWEALDRTTYPGGGSGWASDLSGDPFITVYGNKMIRMIPEVADTVAYYYLKLFETSTNLDSWTGPYYDYLSTSLPNWICGGTGCNLELDLDLDGTPFGSDPDEAPMFMAYQDSVLAKMERGLQEIHGDDDFVMIGNGNGSVATQYAGYLDYAFAEMFDVYAPVTNGQWLSYINTYPGRLNDTRVSEPMIMYETAATDNDAIYYAEAVALICNGTSNVYSEADAVGYGRSMMPRITTLGNSGAETVAASVSTDTLSRGFENYTVWAIGDIDGQNSPPGPAPLPYIIIAANGDTLRRGGGWPRADDTTAPDQITDLYVDNYIDQVDLSWTASEPADFAEYRLYRAKVVKDGLSPAVTTSDLYKILPSSSSFSDTMISAANDTTYLYRIAAVDASANVATLSNQVSATPTPTARPAITVSSMDYTEGTELAEMSATTDAPIRLSFRSKVAYNGTWTSAVTLDTLVTAATHYVDVTSVTTGDTLYIEASDPIDPGLASTVVGTVEIARTPPDSTFFAAVSFDTTTTTNVRLNLAMTTDDDALAWWQWKETSAGTWSPSTAQWYSTTNHADSTFASFLTDTIFTTRSTADVAGDTIYVRAKIKDAAQNVSDWLMPSVARDSVVFARAATADYVIDKAMLYIADTETGGATLIAAVYDSTSGNRIAVSDTIICSDAGGTSFWQEITFSGANRIELTPGDVLNLIVYSSGYTSIPEDGQGWQQWRYNGISIPDPLSGGLSQNCGLVGFYIANSTGVLLAGDDTEYSAAVIYLGPDFWMRKRYSGFAVVAQ